MDDLFDRKRGYIPLAYKLRPFSLEEFEGQPHLISRGKVLFNALKNDNVGSYIFWGPPGSGKTSLANIIALNTKSVFLNYSAVLSGIKEIKTLLKEARDNKKYYNKRTILFIDEIHRFNKAQQDAFLPFVENGDIILIGATTENPSFEVNTPLLSRLQVLKLNPLKQGELVNIFKRAVNIIKKEYSEIKISEDNLGLIAKISRGDARVGLNILEIIANYIRTEKLSGLDNKKISSLVEKNYYRYDKTGEEHFNLISAFHKSLRGSDPDAAVYYLMRMLKGGEDPLYIIRRMVAMASEDIGNADPQALLMAVAAKNAYEFLGLPEGELCIVQAAVYLATAPKSNSVYKALKEAKVPFLDLETKNSVMQ